jgi:hypothetical protein
MSDCFSLLLGYGVSVSVCYGVSMLVCQSLVNIRGLNVFLLVNVLIRSLSIYL